MDYPKTKAEALANGIKFYFTGEPCKRGHISKRIAKSNYCYQCWYEVKRAWLKKSGKAKEYTAAYRERNVAELREKNRIAIAASRRANPARYKVIRQQYYLHNKEEFLVRNVARRQAMRQHTPPWVTPEQSAAMLALARECRRVSKSTGEPHEVDHIVPLLGQDCSGLNVPWNLEIVTRVVNRSKHAGGKTAPVAYRDDGSVVYPELDRATAKRWWLQLNAVELDGYVDFIFAALRRGGFPYPALATPEKIVQSFALSRNALDKHAELQRLPDSFAAIGKVTPSCYFPHMFEVRSFNSRSPYDAFFDDDVLRDAIRRRLKVGTYMSANGMRKMLSILPRTRGVSNFRPVAAAYLYERYAGANATVLDPCAGWAGRLFGAAIARNVIRYIGVEPSIRTVVGLRTAAADVAGYVNADIIMSPFEDAVISEPVDMAFTSPPYFDCERYDDAPTQSFARYPSAALWFNGFLLPMMDRTYKALRSGGVFCVNIADVASYKCLESDTVAAALSVGFTLEDTLLYAMPHRTKGANATLVDGTEKGEPVFVFRKNVS